LGNPHPVEKGFLWHPTLGTPSLPGSGVKGLVRAWVEAWMPFDGYQARLDTFFRYFGS
jgi:CRISPR-associated protein Cmr6